MHKKTTLFIASLLLTISAFSQKIFFDSRWKRTNEANANYYRLIDTLTANDFKVNDYYMDGQLQMDGHFSSIKKETKEGKFVWYWANGTKMQACSYKDGNLHGLYHDFHPNGNPKALGKYVMGQRDSTWTWWDSTGVMLSTGSYLNGKETGIWTTFYKNGSKRNQLKMLNGHLDGFVQEFDSTGVLVVEVDLDAAFENGLVTMYQRNGKLLGQGQIKNGSPNGVWCAYSPSGTLIAMGGLKDGWMMGTWQYYSEDGNPLGNKVFARKDKKKFPLNMKELKKQLPF